MRTLLSGGVVVTCDADHAVFEGGDVLLDDDRIAFVGPRYTGDIDRHLDVSGHIVMPGLINAHTHSPMTLFRSLSDDVDLRVFLEERVWPREVVLTPEDVYAGAVLAAVEMLRSGVTTYVDMYFWEDELARAAVDTGIRSVQTPGILQTPAWEPILGSWERRTQDVLDFSKCWQGREGRIHTGLGPHATYTLPIDALAEIALEGRRHKLPVHMHILEAAWERDSLTSRGGGGVVSALEDIGFFDGDVLAAHSVWIGPGDAEIYRRHGVGVAHCPQSNAKLGCGIAPLASLLAAGVRVGLGTDGAATNNNLDLWEEVHLAPLLAKVSALDPTLVSAQQTLDMATRLGAEAIHLPEVGVLETGRRADVITLDLDESMVPVFSSHTYVDHLAYVAGRHLVDSVWVNGRQVVRDREILTVDVDAVRASAQQAALAVAQRVEN